MNQLNWEREKSVKPESGPLKNTIKLINIWAHLPIRETEREIKDTNYQYQDWRGDIIIDCTVIKNNKK